jgi:hypothetical protein
MLRTFLLATMAVVVAGSLAAHAQQAGAESGRGRTASPPPISQPQSDLMLRLFLGALMETIEDGFTRDNRDEAKEIDAWVARQQQQRSMCRADSNAC